MSNDLKLTTLAWVRLILTDRAQRRRWISGVLLSIIVVFVLGNWPLASWISSSPWIFLAWWGGCALLCFFLIVFTLYDVLRVIQEERENFVGKGEKDD